MAPEAAVYYSSNFDTATQKGSKAELTSEIAKLFVTHYRNIEYHIYRKLRVGCFAAVRNVQYSSTV